MTVDTLHERYQQFVKAEERRAIAELGTPTRLTWNDRYRYHMAYYGLKIVSDPPALDVPHRLAPSPMEGSENPWANPSWIVCMTDVEIQVRADTAKADDTGDAITITFSRHAWRLLAIAAVKVNRGSFINPEDHKRVQELGGIIAERTGKPEVKSRPVRRHKGETRYITVDGQQSKIVRGSREHAEIDSTHRMRPDGSYFK